MTRGAQNPNRNGEKRLDTEGATPKINCIAEKGNNAVCGKTPAAGQTKTTLANGRRLPPQNSILRVAFHNKVIAQNQHRGGKDKITERSQPITLLEEI